MANTTATIAQLLPSPTAILLENASVDTALPLAMSIPDRLHLRSDPGSYIVQARGPFNAAFRARLAAAGVAMVSYIPNNACLVRASASTAAQLRSSPEVQAVLPYEPSYKLKQPLLDLAAGANPDGDQNVELTVLLFPDSRDSGLAALAALSAAVLSEESSPFGVAVRIRARVRDLPALAIRPEVEELELAHPRVAACDLTRVTLGVATNSSAPINYLGLTGSNVLVNLNDTGVDANHPDLAGRVVCGSPAGGVDTNGHGTHVAGIIAGNGSQSLVVTAAPGSSLPATPTQFRGLAPAARLFSIPVALAAGGYTSDAALQQAAALTNAWISNNSWHYEGACQYDLAAASYDAATRDALPSVPGAQPLLCVFPAGNAGAGNPSGTGGQRGTIASPATAKNVITVGALEQLRAIANVTWTCSTNGSVSCHTNAPWLEHTDSNGQVAAFSSRGNVGAGTEGAYGRFKPDLVAPGTFVISTRSAQWNPAATFSPTNNFLVTAPDANYFTVLSNLDTGLQPQYRFESGTSLAAADVAGTLALIEEFFQRRLNRSNSPALMKALLINGARSASSLYDLSGRGSSNLQGWGIINLTNCLPSALTNTAAASRPLFFADQSATEALSTGQSRTRFFSVSAAARPLPLRCTLVWTDPPGNPVAALKLVNDLDLVVTNLDTGQVFFGNDIQPGHDFNSASNSPGPPNSDSVNNVENVFLAPALGSNYSVTILARRVSVNAVTTHPNDSVQDYALVVSCGNGQVADALTMTDGPVLSDAAPSVTELTNTFAGGCGVTGTILFHERAGADAPLLNTNHIPLPDGTNALSLGLTNQWRFYVISNENAFTNAAFLTFLPATQSLPFLGTTNPIGFTNATRYEADVDLYVSTNSALTNLDLEAVAAAAKSLSRGGTELVLLAGAIPGPYYIGVKSESQQAADFGFLAAFSELPFGETDQAGNQLLRGIPPLAPILGGNHDPVDPTCVFGVTADRIPVRRVIVTNTITHPAMIDLTGSLSHRSTSVGLNYHATNGPVVAQPFIYDDSVEGDVPGAQRADGPGSLEDFGGSQGFGQWRLTQTSSNHPGTNDSLLIFLERQPDLVGGVISLLLPGACRQDYLRLPAGVTNLTATVSLVSGPGPIQCQVFPSETGATNSPNVLVTNPAFSGVVLLDKTTHPPVNPGLFVIRLCNLGSESAEAQVQVTFGVDPASASVVQAASAVSTPILDDAVSRSTLRITNTAPVFSAEVGVRIDHPRVSDLVLHLANPQGVRVLLSENRGGTSANMGLDVLTTNITPVSYNGHSEAVTNTFDVGTAAGTVAIDFDFYPLPDTMLVYYGNQVIFDSGLISGPGSTNLAYGPGASTLTIVMNQGGNPDPNTAWFYRVTATRWSPLHLTFTENTNLAATPIKFAVPPLTNLTVSSSAYPPSGGIFYLTEEYLSRLAGQSAAGEWALEITDSRAGPAGQTPVLVSWQLALTLDDPQPAPISLTHDLPVTVSVPPGQVQWFSVDVPVWAGFATNRLQAASLPVNLLFNQNSLPTGTTAGDRFLLTGVADGTATLQTSGSPPLVPGARYYLGVQNTNDSWVSFALTVDLNVTPLANLVPVSDHLVTGAPGRYFYYEVSPDATAVSFQLSNLNGDLNLVARRGLPFPTSSSYDAASLFPGTNSEEILLLTNGLPIALTPGRWYLGVLNPAAVDATYEILAVEYTNPIPGFFTLSSGVPFDRTLPGPAGATDYYLFQVSPNAVRAQFEIDQTTDDLTLVLRKGLPLPSLTQFDAISANPGPNDEWIVLHTFSRPVPLTPGNWFLAAINAAEFPVAYAIMATEFTEPGTNIYITSTVLAGDCLWLYWTSLPGVHYFVQGKTNLADPDWVTLSPTLTAGDSLSSFCLSLPSPFHFFRIQEGLVLLPAPAKNSIPGSFHY